MIASFFFLVCGVDYRWCKYSASILCYGVVDSRRQLANLKLFSQHCCPPGEMLLSKLLTIFSISEIVKVNLETL